MDYSKLIEPDDISDEPFIFVSYSRQDMSTVQVILEILRNNYFRFWYDKGIKSGTEWAEELGDKIDRCDQFLVLISPNSVKSKYVRKEIAMAISNEKNILVLYLEETTLSRGLELLIGDIQSIHKQYFGNDSDFAQAICKAASNNTLYQSTDVFCELDDKLGGIAENELLRSYRILSQIGAGGLARVFLAEHRRTGALVAVKCGTISKSYGGTVIKDCFKTEKKILATMMRNMCPYTPVILDWFEDDSRIFIVESLINGTSLKSRVSYSEEEVVSIAKKVLNILRYLHNNNIIYRDIKPGNLIADKYGEIYLIDFNSAVIIEEGVSETGVLLGTVGFAPPEQFNTDSLIDPSLDIYALGRTMEYLLCPEQFDKNARISIRYYRRDISVELESILEKMMASSQSDRYQSAEELLREFEKYNCTNLLKKFLLLIKSRKNIYLYKDENRKNIKKRKDILHEMAVDSQSYAGEIAYKTVILTSEGKASTES